MIDLLKADTILKDRYVIVKVLGRGGWGVVYLARDLRLNSKFWAVKEMFALCSDGRGGFCLNESPIPERSADEDEQFEKEVLEQFKTEAEILSSLEHPYLTRVLDWFYENNRYYFVMDYVEGKTFFQLVKESKGFLHEADVIDWALQVCDVLFYIHSRNPPVIFRDLTPANIMVNKENKIKLIDFGLAKLYNAFKATRAIIKTGSPGFCPPEQYGFGPTDGRSDIYSFGATLYYLITSKIPKESIYIYNNSSELVPPVEINPSISKELQRIILRAMNVESSNRYGHVEEMKQDLIYLKENLWAKHKVISCSACSEKNSLEVNNCTGCKKILDEEKALFFYRPGWTMFCSSPDRTGSFPEQLSPVEKWVFITGDKIHSSPAVTEKEVFVGSCDGNLYSIDRDTGTEIWRFSAEGKIFSSPSVIHNMVYFGSSDGSVYGLDIKTGEKIWNFKTKAIVKSSPAIYENSIFFGSGDSCFYCLDLEKGVKRWYFKSEDRINSTPSITEGRIFFASSDRNLYCLDCNTGELIWKTQLENYILSSPALYGNTLFIGAGEIVYGIDVTEGNVIWQFRTGDHITTCPCTGYGRVYIGSYDGNLYALDMDRGKCIWKFFTDDKIVSSPALDFGTVYFGSCDCNIYALDARTGIRRWSYYLGEEIYSSPSVIERTLYIGCNNGNLYALKF
ncbi:MAG: serine/threonine-protein kinase [Candidatus Eremiobacterota bacterium]